jgi:transposase-like protein
MTMPHAIDTGVVVHYLVRCESCGRQNKVAVVVQGRNEPRFVCSGCGANDPIVDQVPASSPWRGAGRY